MINKLNKLKDYFGYSKSEKNGILFLFIILISTIVINILLPYIIQPQKTDFTAFKDQINAFEERQTAIEDSLNDLRLSRKNYFKANKINLNPFYFDPNNLPVEDWEKLGLKNWQIEMIKKYESKGGKFNQPEDLEKMYSISEEEFKILEPYINISPKTETLKSIDLIPFQFDPNKISRENLLRMNMRENLINAIINYRNKGGKFYKKNDLQKIYTISDQEFTLLEPFILFEKDTIQFEPGSIPIQEILMIEVNTADTLDLQQLKGIGPAFASRIIKYRNMLGGYHDKNQLLEVYGMDQNRFEGIADHIMINDSLITKVNINKATIKEMIKHPYIEFYVAKSIITYREEIGLYKNLEEIKNAKLIYEELYQKIMPYLTMN